MIQASPMRRALRADSSQYYAIKQAFEQTFGNKAWLELKECTVVGTWKKYTANLLRAIQLAIDETVRFRDDAWFREINGHIEHGLEISRAAKSLDELLSGLAATLISVVFLQVGMFPNRRSRGKVTLARNNWRLDKFRTVQYIQNKGQLEALFWSEQQTALGVEKQMALWNQYRASKAKGPYSAWCAARNVSASTA
jgi:hypothetical protein